jgi:hypothetical protein
MEKIGTTVFFYFLRIKQHNEAATSILQNVTLVRTNIVLFPLGSMEATRSVTFDLSASTEPSLKKISFHLFAKRKRKNTSEKGEIQKHLLTNMPAYIYNNKIVVSLRVSNCGPFSKNEKATNRKKF